MTLQWLLVAVATSVAGVYLGRQTWRTWRGGCGDGCSAKKPAPGLIPASDLTLRLRQRTESKRDCAG